MAINLRRSMVQGLRDFESILLISLF